MPVALSEIVGPLDFGMRGVQLDARDAAQRDRDIVVGRPRAVGPVAPKPVIEQWISRGLVAARTSSPSPSRAMMPGPEVLEQDIGARDELEQDRAAFILAQVELDAALAAVVGDEIGAVLPAAEIAERIAAIRMLDLENVRAQVRQHHAGQRRRDHGAELDHAHALEDVSHRSSAPTPRHRSHAKVRARHRAVARKHLCLALADDAAEREQIGAVRHRERPTGVLLDHQDAQPRRRARCAPGSRTGRTTRRGASPSDGSSSSRSLGCDISARPIATICCSPPLMVRTAWPAALGEPREQVEDALERRCSRPRARGRVGAEHQVFHHRHGSISRRPSGTARCRARRCGAAG